jgi:hypothetical protein
MYGRLITTLVDGDLPAGTYSTVFDATHLASGQYLCLLRTPTAVTSRVMTVVK